MIVVVAKYLIPNGYRAITVFPFIILSDEKDKNDEILMNHEKIHIRQQMELLILPFFIWYGVEYFLRFAKSGNHSKAYYAIGFEREAYANESVDGYLIRRKIFQFLKYI